MVWSRDLALVGYGLGPTRLKKISSRGRVLDIEVADAEEVLDAKESILGG